MDDYTALITPKVDGPYRAKTTDWLPTVDGTIQTRTLIHDWTGRNGRLIAIVHDDGDGSMARFDYNPNADAADIVTAYKAWLSAAYPSQPNYIAEDLAYKYLIAQEAGVNA